MAPIEYDTSVNDFLQHTLNTKGFELIPLAGDASARRYARVIYGSETFVLMIWEPFKEDGNYPFTSVQRHFNKHHVHVPDIIDSSPDRGLILLEDLGDLTLERKFWEAQNQENVLPFYEQAIDELIKIHYASTDDKSYCTAFNIEFDKEKFLWEMNYGREHLLQKFCGINMNSTELHMLSQCFSGVCEKLASQPKRISHRDYHSRNLMIKLGNMRVIDFQDARMGPIQYDLVSLLHDSYVQLNADSINKLLQYYRDQASEESQQKFSLDEFNYIFTLQMVQRCFKACGSFASFYNMRSDTRYLKYIKGTLHKVYQSLDQLNEFDEFKSFLIDHGLLDREYKVP
ncbi:MAG: phosphotransferase [Bdellovibrionales bacterium]|nr:phosphotransferase [Bdellovibrionales bacterium]